MATNQSVKEHVEPERYDLHALEAPNDSQKPPVTPPPRPKKSPITDPPIPPFPDDPPSKDPEPIGEPPTPIQPVIL